MASAGDHSILKLAQFTLNAAAAAGAGNQQPTIIDMPSSDPEELRPLRGEHAYSKVGIAPAVSNSLAAAADMSRGRLLFVQCTTLAIGFCFAGGALIYLLFDNEHVHKFIGALFTVALKQLEALQMHQSNTTSDVSSTWSFNQSEIDFISRIV